MDNKSKKSTYIIAGVALVAILAGIYFLFIFKKSAKQIKIQDSSGGEVKQLSEIPLAKRPYLTLTPTSTGSEIIISMENMADFDKIEYELTYQADNPTAPGTKIERGATGTDINTKDQKYKKSVLLGTASKGVSSPDRGISDGKFTLHLFKGDQEYQNESPWSLEQIGQTKATLKDASGNFTLNVPGLGKDYWVILADTVGVPQKGTFDIKNVALPSFGVFSIAGAFTSAGDLSIKLPDAKTADLYIHSTLEDSWQKADTKFDDSSKTLTTKVSNFATFVSVASK